MKAIFFMNLLNHDSAHHSVHNPAHDSDDYFPNIEPMSPMTSFIFSAPTN